MNLVCVKDSSIQNAGKGVFVKQTVKKGTMLCYYDGYFVDAVRSDDEQIYSITLNGKNFIGYSNIKNADGCAQLTNDVYMPRYDLLDSGATIYKQIEFLINESINYCIACTTCNVGAQGRSDELWFVALTDIQEGSELYFAYGVGYWLDYYRRRNPELRNIINLFMHIYLCIMTDVKVGVSNGNLCIAEDVRYIGNTTNPETKEMPVLLRLSYVLTVPEKLYKYIGQAIANTEYTKII